MNSHNIKLALRYILALAITSTLIASIFLFVLSLAVLTASFLTWEWLPNIALALVILRVSYTLAFIAVAIFLYKDHHGFMEIVKQLVDGDSDDLD